MRIISGKHKGRRITAPKNLPVRPTTDLAKESLFNILNNHYYLDTISVIDLFSGLGTLGLPLTVKAMLHCVESNTKLLDALAYGVRHTQGIKKVTVEARDLFRNPIYHTDMSSFDAAVIDPPRAGAEQQVRQLAQSHMHNIAMVSCNPVTFARDARILCETGFKIKWLEVVDQFRWSSHIEIVASFCKN